MDSAIVLSRPGANPQSPACSQAPIAALWLRLLVSTLDSAMVLSRPDASCYSQPCSQTLIQAFWVGLLISTLVSGMVLSRLMPTATRCNFCFFALFISTSRGIVAAGVLLPRPWFHGADCLLCELPFYCLVASNDTIIIDASSLSHGSYHGAGLSRRRTVTEGVLVHLDEETR